MTVIDSTPPDAGTRDPEPHEHLKVVLGWLSTTTGEAAAVAATLPDGMPLVETLDLIADIDAVAVQLGMLREQLERRARAARGWKSHRAAFEDRGLRGERVRSGSDRWDVPAGAGRVAGLLRVNPDTGELDVDVDPRTVETLLRRFLAVASVSSYRKTVLRDMGVEFGDLVVTEDRPRRVKVYRAAVPSGPSGAGA